MTVTAYSRAAAGKSAGGGEGLKVRERRPAAAGDQPGGEVGVAVAVRHFLGRAEGRQCGAGGAVGGEELGDLEVAVLARDDQRRCATDTGLVDRSARLEKQPRALDVAVLARHEQRHSAVVAGLADRSAGLEEQPGALQAALLAYEEQRRGAVLLWPD